LTYKWEVLNTRSWKVTQIETGKQIIVALNMLGEHVFSLRHGTTMISYTCDDRTEIEHMLDANL
jgi:hypothetical protein